MSKSWISIESLIIKVTLKSYNNVSLYIEDNNSLTGPYIPIDG